jgi:hypothetical protein
MLLTLRLSDGRTEMLRRCADREGRSMHRVALRGIQESLAPAHDDRSARLAERGAQRYAELLRRLSE